MYSKESNLDTKLQIFIFISVLSFPGIFPFKIRDKIDLRWCMAQLWCIPTHVRPVSIIEQSSQKETQQISVIKIDSIFILETQKLVNKLWNIVNTV